MSALTQSGPPTNRPVGFERKYEVRFIPYGVTALGAILFLTISLLCGAGLLFLLMGLKQNATVIIIELVPTAGFIFFGNEFRDCVKRIKEIIKNPTFLEAYDHGVWLANGDRFIPYEALAEVRYDLGTRGSASAYLMVREGKEKLTAVRIPFEINRQEKDILITIYKLALTHCKTANIAPPQWTGNVRIPAIELQ